MNQTDSNRESLATCRLQVRIPQIATVITTLEAHGIFQSFLNCLFYRDIGCRYRRGGNQPANAIRRTLPPQQQQKNQDTSKAYVLVFPTLYISELLNTFVLFFSYRCVIQEFTMATCTKKPMQLNFFDAACAGSVNAIGQWK